MPYKAKKKLNLWIYDPNKKEKSLNIETATVTKTLVECKFRREIKKKNSTMIEYTYTHPRTKKQLIGVTSYIYWQR